MKKGLTLTFVPNYLYVLRHSSFLIFYSFPEKRKKINFAPKEPSFRHTLSAKQAKVLQKMFRDLATCKYNLSFFSYLSIEDKLNAKTAYFLALRRLCPFAVVSSL